MRATKCTKAFSKGWSTLQTRASYTNYHQQQQHQLKPPKCNTKNIRVCSTLPILTEKKLWVSSVAVQTVLLGTIAHQGDMRSCKECVTWRCMVVKDNGTSHKRRYLLHCVPRWLEKLQGILDMRPHWPRNTRTPTFEFRPSSEWIRSYCPVLNT